MKGIKAPFAETEISLILCECSCAICAFKNKNYQSVHATDCVYLHKFLYNRTIQYVAKFIYFETFILSM